MSPRWPPSHGMGAHRPRWPLARCSGPSATSADSRSRGGLRVRREEQPSDDALLEVDRALSTLQRALLDCRERWPASARAAGFALCNTLARRLAMTGLPHRDDRLCPSAWLGGDFTGHMGRSGGGTA